MVLLLPVMVGVSVFRQSLDTHTHIQKSLALLPRQYPKAAETTSQVFKAVSPFDKLEVLSIHYQNHKGLFKNMSVFN